MSGHNCHVGRVSVGSERFDVKDAVEKSIEKYKSMGELDELACIALHPYAFNQLRLTFQTEELFVIMGHTDRKIPILCDEEIENYQSIVYQKH